MRNSRTSFSQAFYPVYTQFCRLDVVQCSYAIITIHCISPNQAEERLHYKIRLYDKISHEKGRLGMAHLISQNFPIPACQAVDKCILYTTTTLRTQCKDFCQVMPTTFTLTYWMREKSHFDNRYYFNIFLKHSQSLKKIFNKMQPLDITLVTSNSSTVHTCQ